MRIIKTQYVTTLVGNYVIDQFIVIFLIDEQMRR